jgi:hypothetical protein
MKNYFSSRLIPRVKNYDGKNPTTHALSGLRKSNASLGDRNSVFRGMQTTVSSNHETTETVGLYHVRVNLRDGRGVIPLIIHKSMRNIYSIFY